MDLETEIRKLAEMKLAPGQFVVDVVVSARQGPGKVLVTIDGDHGISIDDCAEISRQLSKSLDDMGMISHNYMLEVSTPGLEQPLKLRRQYRKNIGRNLRLKLQDKTLEGKLAEVTEEKIILTQETGPGKNKEVQQIDVPFSVIEKAFVMVSFK